MSERKFTYLLTWRLLKLHCLHDWTKLLKSEQYLLVVQGVKRIILSDRPLNFHCFTMCHTVLLPFSRSHGRFLISHNFTNFEQIFSQTHSFLKKKKKTHRHHIPMLLKNAFLVWLIKITQAIAVLYLWVGHFCSTHFNGSHYQTYWR